jgi:hypothetical protein
MTNKIMRCFCESEFQDGEYGHGNRLFSLTKKVNTWRCTVCGKELTSGSAEKVKKGKEKKEKEKKNESK